MVVVSIIMSTLRAKGALNNTHSAHFRIQMPCMRLYISCMRFYLSLKHMHVTM